MEELKVAGDASEVTDSDAQAAVTSAAAAKADASRANRHVDNEAYPSALLGLRSEFYISIAPARLVLRGRFVMGILKHSQQNL